MSKNRDVLVFLSDSNFIEQAKQLFSSVYHNAGWKGDYLLLAHQVAEDKLKWFRNKGVFIKRCEPLTEIKNFSEYSPVVLDKFYLFTPEFKKWNTIVFLDSDVIVKSSLENLARCKNFSAVQDMYFNKLSSQLKHPEDISCFKKEFKVNAPVFNSGVFAFNSSLINDDTFAELIKLSKKYMRFAKYPEQLILNLYFQKKWKKLPVAYNVFITYHYYILPNGLEPVVIHFFARLGEFSPLFKPLWHPENLYYNEWKKNLELSEKIDLHNKKNARNRSKLNIIYHSLLLKHNTFLKKTHKIIIYILDTPIRLLGKTGEFINKRNPTLYKKLKSLITKNHPENNE